VGVSASSWWGNPNANAAPSRRLSVAPLPFLSVRAAPYHHPDQHLYGRPKPPARSAWLTGKTIRLQLLAAGQAWLTGKAQDKPEPPTRSTPSYRQGRARQSAGRLSGGHGQGRVFRGAGRAAERPGTREGPYGSHVTIPWAEFVCRSRSGPRSLRVGPAGGRPPPAAPARLSRVQLIWRVFRRWC